MKYYLNKWIHSPLLWAGIAFLIYALFATFIAPWIYPGKSIHALIDTLRLSDVTTSHFCAPLTESCLYAIRLIVPADYVIEAFNIITVLFGTLNVFLFGCSFIAMIRVFFEHTSAEPYIETIIKWALPIASIFFMTTPEVLRAATHFQVQTFQLTFLLLATAMTFRAIQREKANGFLLSSLLITLVVFESKETLLLAPPLFIASLVGYYLNVGQLSLKPLFLTFVLPAIFAFFVIIGLCECLPFTLRGVLVARYYELAPLLFMKSGILILVLGFLPLIVAFAMLRRTSLNIHTFQLLVIYLTLSLLGLAIILPVSFNPIRLLGLDQTETYPLVLITCMSLTLGFIMAMTTAYRVIRRPAEGGEDDPLQRRRLRYLGYFFTVTIPIMVGIIAMLSVTSTVLMDRAHTHITRDILDQKIDAFGKNDTWVIDNSLMAQCVALRCHKRNINWVTFISPEALLKPITVGDPLHQLLTESGLLRHYLSDADRQDLAHYASLNGQVYLKALINKCPQLLSSIHTFTPSTSLWNELSSDTMQIVPLYTGSTFMGLPVEGLHQHKLVQTSPAKPVAPTCLGYPQDIGFDNFIKNTRQEACKHHLETASRLAQVRQEHCNTLALQHLQAAHVLDAENVQSIRDGILTYLKDNILAIQGIAIPSALSLKNNALTDASMDIGAAIVFDDKHRLHNLDWLILLPSYTYYTKTRERGTSIQSMPAYQQLRYQNLAQQEKPKLSQEEEDALRAKYQKAFSLEKLAHYHMKQTQNLEAALQAINELEVLLDATDVSYLRAFYWNLKGDATQSLTHLNVFLGRYPNNIEALALLATLQLEAGEIENIRLKTLPRIRSAAGTEKNYYYYIIQAQIAERQMRLNDARTAFLQAIEANPRDMNIKVKETVLILDMRLSDKEAAKQHASEFLKRDIEFPFAHYVLGSIALSENRTDTAMFHLKQASIGARTPLAMAYNDLAELHRRLQDYTHACEYAQAAYSLDPTLSIAHETAASAHIALKQFDIAEQEINTAIAISKKLAPGRPLDARIRLTRAILFTQTDRMLQAREELRLIDVAALDEASQREYYTLRSQLL